MYATKVDHYVIKEAIDKSLGIYYDVDLSALDTGSVILKLKNNIRNKPIPSDFVESLNKLKDLHFNKTIDFDRINKEFEFHHPTHTEDFVSAVVQNITEEQHIDPEAEYLEAIQQNEIEYQQEKEITDVKLPDDEEKARQLAEANAKAEQTRRNIENAEKNINDIKLVIQDLETDVKHFDGLSQIAANDEKKADAKFNADKKTYNNALKTNGYHMGMKKFREELKELVELEAKNKLIPSSSGKGKKAKAKTISSLNPTEAARLLALQTTVKKVDRVVDGDYKTYNNSSHMLDAAKNSTLKANADLKNAQDNLTLERAKLNNAEAFLTQLKNAAVSGGRISGGGVFGFSFGSLVLIAVLVLAMLIVIYFTAKYFFPCQSYSKYSNNN